MTEPDHLQRTTDDQDLIDDLEGQVDQLTQARNNRTTIGIAIGILMERLDLDRDAAVKYLKRISQDSNRKLYDLALIIAETRQLPS